MKYLSKGELLIALGNSADKFTEFFISPETFGVSGDTLLEMKVAKQKLDWTNTVNLELPEIKNMISLLTQYGVVSQTDADNVMNTQDRSDGDIYVITIKAQDDITVNNIFGAVLIDNMYDVRVIFNNKTAGTTLEEHFRYATLPTIDAINVDVSTKITMLKEAL